MSDGFLLDTSVLSLLAPGRTTDKALSDWLRQQEARLFISAVTIAEIQQGICKLKRSGGEARAALLTVWLMSLLAGGGERILVLDADTGMMAGSLSDRALAMGRHPGFADVAIAATAMVHGLVLLTCNGKHFAPLGVSFIDPSEDLPS